MATSLASPTTRHTGFERSAIIALFAATVMAAAGYSIYALHPERLAATPVAGVVYGYALRFAPPAHIIVGVLVLAAILTRRAGTAWIPAAITLYCISLASELFGTTTGVPFGPTATRMAWASNGSRTFRCSSPRAGS